MQPLQAGLRRFADGIDGKQALILLFGEIQPLGVQRGAGVALQLFAGKRPTAQHRRLRFLAPLAALRRRFELRHPLFVLARRDERLPLADGIAPGAAEYEHGQANRQQTTQAQRHGRSTLPVCSVCR